MLLLGSLNCPAQSPEPEQVTERNVAFDTAVVTPGFAQPLRLRGTSTWNERFLPLFMAGLYLPQGVNKPEDDLAPKRLELVWRNKLLAADRIGQWWKRKLEAGFTDAEQRQRNQARIDQYVQILARQPANQRWVFEYQPDAGTVIYVGGQKALHVVGADINRVLWNIWLGPQAPANFRKGITGKVGL